MKNFFSILIIISIVGLGFYFLSSKSTLPLEPIQPNFFSPSEILSTDIVVKFNGSEFVPPEIVVERGQRVVFVNESSTWVWPASDPHPIHTDDPGFDPLEPFKTGEAWAFTFDKTGNWGYHNHLFSGHRGKVIVK